MIKNFSIAFSYNLLGPLVGFAAMPLLSRHYQPDVLGEYFLNLSVASVAAIFIGGALGNGLLVEKKLPHVALLYREICVIQIIAALGLAALALVFGVVWSNPGTADNLRIEPLSIVLALCLSLSACGQLLANRLNAHGHAGRTSLFRIALAVTLQVVLARTVSTGIMSLMVGAIIAEFVAFILFSLLLRTSNWLEATKSLLAVPGRVLTRSNRLRVKRHLHFCVFMMPSQILGAASNLLPYVFLRMSGSLTLMGYFGMLCRLTMTPTNSAVQAIRATYWNWIRDEERDIYKSARSVALALYVVGGLSVAAYAYLAPPLIEKLLGPEWVDIDSFVPFILFWVLTSLGNTPLVESVKLAMSTKYILIVEILGATGKLLTLLGAFHLYVDNLLEVFCVGAGTLNLAIGLLLLFLLRSGRPVCKG